MRVLRGNLHVHSDISDGTLALPEIARTAAQCRLDFVGINDHHVKCSDNNYLEGVLVLMGTEFNSCHSHYLAYNSHVSYPETQVDGARLVKDVKESGGMGIIAHPFEKGSPLVSKGKFYPWKDWNVWGYDGIEVWNQTSQWRDAATSLFRALWMWIFDRHRPFRAGACPQALAKWDEVCQARHVTGLAGSDLHAPLIGWKGIGCKILDYPMLFSTVNNYVMVQEISGNADLDSAQLINAMTMGRCWFAQDKLELAHGFSFTAETGQSQVGLGELLKIEAGHALLKVKIPTTGEVTVFLNGKPINKTVAKTFQCSVAAHGVYRVEVRLKRNRKWVPWIYSNPIYIK